MPADDDDQWVPALADCTSLTTVTVLGEMMAPIPDGRYLSRLKQLTWLARRGAPLTKALAAAKALKSLTVRLQLDHDEISDCDVLGALPNLRKLAVKLRKDEPGNVSAFLELQRRLCAVEITCEVAGYAALVSAMHHRRGLNCACP